MQINIEKKHLYIFLSVTIVLFSSLVIAQTFTIPAWDTSKQSHDVLYTNIITSKASTPRVVKVEGDLEITGGSGITLGGVKQTSWPTGSTPQQSGRCIVTEASKDTTYSSTWITNLICIPNGAFDGNQYCVNPTSYTTIDQVVKDWCNAETGGGCTIELGETYDPVQFPTGSYTSGGAGDVSHVSLFLYPGINGLDGEGQSAQFIGLHDGNPLNWWDPSRGSSLSHPSTKGCTFRETVAYNQGAGDPFTHNGNNNWILEIGREGSQETACKLVLCKR